MKCQCLQGAEGSSRLNDPHLEWVEISSRKKKGECENKNPDLGLYLSKLLERNFRLSTQRFLDFLLLSD